MFILFRHAIGAALTAALLVGAAGMGSTARAAADAPSPVQAAADSPVPGQAGTDSPAAATIAPAEAANPPAPPAPGVDPALVAAFTRARRAMVEADLERFDQEAARIAPNHPLQRYIEYWRLRILLSERRVESLSAELDGAVRQYLNRYPDSLAGDLLRRDWLLALGRREDWRPFDEQYPKWVLRDEASPDCYAQLSRLAAGQPDRAAALALVMRPVELTRACRTLFRSLADAGLIDARATRQRLMLALEANSVVDIRHAASLAGLALQADAVDLALRRPAQTLKRESNADLRLIALVRMARTDVEDAVAALDKSAQRLTPELRAFAWSQMAAAGARKLLPEAHDWSVNANPPRKPAGDQVAPAYSDETRRWLVRAALRREEWKWVAALIDGFAAATRDEPEYRYWRARAHMALSQPEKAVALFTKLATRHDYYGKLAREELGQPIAPLPRGEAPPAAQIAAWDGNAGFARARAFYDLGMRFEGNREWNFELRGVDSVRLRSAAWWARQQGLLDRAINTDERLGADADATLRFPTPHADRLQVVAREQGVDPAWVYGLIRQESRFVAAARSSVGAAGLMQIMPGTARWVARQLGRGDFTVDQLDDLQTNLEFGTFYLKRVLDTVDGSALLASAGYNAGPRRARDWRATLTRPIEGAIFAELIPFSETRGYVKHVLSNTVDYAALATGQPQSLKRWLGQVAPGASTAVAMP